MDSQKEFNEKFIRFCNEIMQHDSTFVSIRCLVTKKEGNTSLGWDVGVGCYYSFLGKTRELMIMDDQRTRNQINNAENSNTEESDIG